MENFLTQITNYLLTQSWQIVVLVVVIAGVNLVLKNRSAHVRYLLWLIVLAKCLVPPLFTIPLAVLPQERYTEPVPISPVPMPRVAFEAADMDIAKPTLSTSTLVATPSRPTVTEKLARLTMHQWLALVWIIGASVFTIAALIKALRTDFWLWRQRRPLSAELQIGIEELFSGLGIKTFPKVWLIDGIGQPFVWGLLRGSIYLPADFVKVNSAEYRRDILGHELSHILRFDAAVNILQIIAQAVFWFHPFVWWANKRIRAEREKCCDEMAIARLGAKVKDYSSAIVNILISEYESTRPVPSLAVAGPVKNIEERIKTMMKPGKKFYKHPSLVAMTVVLVLAVLIVPTALVLTARAAPDTTTESDQRLADSLRWATIDGDVKKTNLYLSLGAAVNAKDRKGRTALHHAASEGNTQIAKLLIAQGADVNAKNESEQTPLHHAAVNGKTETADLLILKGTDVNAKDKYGRTPVSRALLSEGGGRRMVELLVSRGAKISSLHLAAHRGDIDKVRDSLKEGINVDARDEAGQTPLYYAASAGQMHIAEFLISKGAEVDAKDKIGDTPLYYAADAGWRNTAELLLNKGADVNARNQGRETPLHSAAWLGRGDVAKLLIAKGANIMAKDKWDYIPLHAAACSGLVEVTELLIAKGSDIDAKDEWAGTPLTYAAEWALGESGYTTVKLLIDRGADVNAACTFGCTILHHASSRYKPQPDVVRLIIANGANVNARHNSGQTPLHWSVRWGGHRDIAELLLTSGADVNAKDKRDRTPLDIALEQGYTEIIDLLRKHGARE